VQRQGVHRSGKLRLEQLIDTLMARYPALAAEQFTHGDDPEMSFGIGRHAVHMAFIGHLEVRRLQRSLQGGLDLLLYQHRRAPKKNGARVYRRGPATTSGGCLPARGRAALWLAGSTVYWDEKQTATGDVTMAVHYSVHFAGEILPGHDPGAVREGLRKLFKANDATLDRLLSGKPQLIKRACDRPTALKYQLAMTRAGARAVISEHRDADAPPSTGPAGAEASRQSMAERVAALAAGSGPADETGKSQNANRACEVSVSTDPISLAPAGADVLGPDERSAPVTRDIDTSTLVLDEPGASLAAPAAAAPPPPDTSHLSEGPVGEDIPTLPRQQTALDPDTSALSLCPPGSDLGAGSDRPPAAPEIDLSTMDLAPAGSDLIEARYRRTEKTAAPDTSHLRIDSGDH
jgi:hypothetical protein